MLVTCINIFIATSKLVLDQGIGHQSLTILIDESNYYRSYCYNLISGASQRNDEKHFQAHHWLAYCVKKRPQDAVLEEQGYLLHPLCGDSKSWHKIVMREKERYCYNLMNKMLQTSGFSAFSSSRCCWRWWCVAVGRVAMMSYDRLDQT